MAGEERRDGEYPLLGFSPRQHRRSGPPQLGQLRFLPTLEVLHQLLFDVVGARERLLLGACF